MSGGPTDGAQCRRIGNGNKCLARAYRWLADSGIGARRGFAGQTKARRPGGGLEGVVTGSQSSADAAFGPHRLGLARWEAVTSKLAARGRRGKQASSFLLVKCCRPATCVSSFLRRRATSRGTAVFLASIEFTGGRGSVMVFSLRGYLASGRI